MQEIERDFIIGRVTASPQTVSRSSSSEEEGGHGVEQEETRMTFPPLLTN